MKKHLLFFIAVMSITVFSSCEKEDENISAKNYFPLKFGNTWVYDSSLEGKDTVYVSGIDTIDGKAYYTLSTFSQKYSDVYMRYDGNKIIELKKVSATTAAPAYTYELIMVNGDVSEGETWVARAYTNVEPGYFSYKIQYLNTLKKIHKSLVLNGNLYKDVMEIEMKMVKSDYVLLEFYDQYDEATKQEIIKNVNASFANPISYTQYFAKGIGYVQQRSVGNPAYDVDLFSYTIQ